MPKKIKILLIVNEESYFRSHRLNLAKSALEAGYDVTVLTRLSECCDDLRQQGISVVDFNIGRSSLNPFAILKEAFLLRHKIAYLQPSVVLAISLRPVIICSLISLVFKFKAMYFITGFGYIFTAKRKFFVIKSVILKLLKIISFDSYIVVQNTDDQQLLLTSSINPANLKLIPGVGVDVNKYTRLINKNKTRIVMFASRLLYDKGIADFVCAAQLLKKYNYKFVIVGPLDKNNPSGISSEVLESYKKFDNIEYWGSFSDLSTVLVKADVFCLPSYREGMPKVMLEAMSCGKACITTNVPGCRDLVNHMVDGLIVNQNDPKELAMSIDLLLTNDHLRNILENNARLKIEKYYDVKLINSITLNLVKSVASNN